MFWYERSSEESDVSMAYVYYKDNTCTII
ncbi:protein of unknown function [Methanoculleus bourgensis]|uniref:Uncharacterized protein n=1 Tax=Methanoculleus bourgensis TaxID=83986 RepID=A0A0X3BR59_9EURY|nr:protein of unknown function [Methanoculleus bourgensis]